MSRYLSKFFIFILAIVFSLIIYLSYFGIETNKFDDLIIKKANELNKNVKLELDKTKIYLNIKKLNFIIKIQKPKIVIKNEKINLTKLNFFLSIKSFVKSDFLLTKAELAFKKNDIKDLTKISRIFLPKIINKQLIKVFEKGSLEGELVIPFELDGKIGKNYKFLGKILDATIKINNQISIKNLTTDINYNNEFRSKGFNATISKANIYDLRLDGSSINFVNETNHTKVKSFLHTVGKFKFNQIKNLSSLLNIDTSFLNDINGKVDLKTDISFDLKNKIKIKNLLYSTIGDIIFLEFDSDKIKLIKKYLPEQNGKISIKNTSIKYKNSNVNKIFELNGLYNLKDKFDDFSVNQVYKHNGNLHNINGSINLTNSLVKFEKINYFKKKGKKSDLNFDISFVPNKKFNIIKAEFLSNKDKIFLSNIKFNKDYEINDFDQLKVKTFLNEIKNNDFEIKKSKKIVASGAVFDSQSLLKSLYKKNNNDVFSSTFKSEVKVNFSKVLTGTNDEVSDLSMIANINKGSYNKLSLKGNFSANEIIEISIYQIDDNKKTLQVISDRARPFIKNFKFIEGFEGGKLEYESIISRKQSDSNLSITNFKVSQVPALAKLLTLASLQGIADTLSGEGIRFDSFEMKTQSKDNILNIEDALAIGPAVSILLDGYVDKGKLISLRGTLVPATKLNSIIATIPIVGDILVGSKTGDGVVGVSFKMKGPPKDIKTSVNPIKTLTPRFIVRAVEKMKKKKQEKIK